MYHINPTATCDGYDPQAEIGTRKNVYFSVKDIQDLYSCRMKFLDRSWDRGLASSRQMYILKKHFPFNKFSSSLVTVAEVALSHEETMSCYAEQSSEYLWVA